MNTTQDIVDAVRERTEAARELPKVVETVGLLAVFEESVRFIMRATNSSLDDAIVFAHKVFLETAAGMHDR
jgi:hypothetical protein